MADVPEATSNPPAVSNSNASRPMPRANTGSVLRNWMSDASMFLIQMERRIDPLFRPAFDALLRDRIARLVTDLMNRKRPNERLRLAEEKALPNEEAYLDSIIDAF
ncbi:MAG TPA: hypothetical protein VH207_01265, partial [Chthoniobacterales bacterium]|nr:hypothetical protein [Chthoniobacterales bacterium]